MTEKRFTLWDSNNLESLLNTFVLDVEKGNLLLNHKECCDLLNELHEENNELRLQLNLCSDQRNEFHRGARENANRVGKLEKENEQLKLELKALRKKYNDFSDAVDKRLQEMYKELDE